MLFGMFLMFVIMVGIEGLLLWLMWRKLAAHLKDNPQGVAALTEHLFVPLLGRNQPTSEDAKNDGSNYGKVADSE
jgi:hypothetical protein